MNRLLTYSLLVTAFVFSISTNAFFSMLHSKKEINDKIVRSDSSYTQYQKSAKKEPKKETRIGYYWRSKKKEPKLIVKKAEKQKIAKQTVQPITVVDYVNEIGVYSEPAYYPEGMVEFLKLKCKTDNFICVSGSATRKMAQVFKRGPSYQARHPGEMLYGMALFEIFYLKKIRESESRIDKFLDNWPSKSVNKSTIISLLKLNVARKKMRNALGMSLNLSTEEAMERFWILGNFLELGEVKKKKISDGVKKRRILLTKYQKTISDFKSSLVNKEEEMYKKINPKYKPKKK